MPAPEFLHAHTEFTDLLRAVAEEKSITPDLIEKDYWMKMKRFYCLTQIPEHFNRQLIGIT